MFVLTNKGEREKESYYNYPRAGIFVKHELSLDFYYYLLFKVGLKGKERKGKERKGKKRKKERTSKETVKDLDKNPCTASFHVNQSINQSIHFKCTIDVNKSGTTLDWCWLVIIPQSSLNVGSKIPIFIAVADPSAPDGDEEEEKEESDGGGAKKSEATVEESPRKR
jgi:hypothetical protein